MLAPIPSNGAREALPAIAADPRNTAVDFNAPPDESLLAAVDKEVFQKRPDIKLRMSNWYGGYFDLTILEQLPSLRRLGLSHVGDELPADLYRIADLPNLTWLSLSLEKLPDASFFEKLPRTLQHLGLGETLRAKGSVRFLAHFRQLESLSILGPARDIDTLGKLSALHTLNLQSITTPSLAFLEPLQNLRELRLALGGTPSLRGLEKLRALEYLQIWQVRNLRDLAEIAELRALTSLFLQSLRNIASLPSLTHLERLKSVFLETMKGLRDFSGIAEAPNLERFSFVAAINCQPRDFEPLLNHPKLRFMRVGMGSKKRNAELDAMIVAHGKIPGAAALYEAERADAGSDGATA